MFSGKVAWPLTQTSENERPRAVLKQSGMMKRRLWFMMELHFREENFLGTTRASHNCTCLVHQCRFCLYFLLLFLSCPLEDGLLGCIHLNPSYICPMGNTSRRAKYKGKQESGKWKEKTSLPQSLSAG